MGAGSGREKRPGRRDFHPPLRGEGRGPEGARGGPTLRSPRQPGFQRLPVLRPRQSARRQASVQGRQLRTHRCCADVAWIERSEIRGLHRRPQPICCYDHPGYRTGNCTISLIETDKCLRWALIAQLHHNLKSNTRSAPRFCRTTSFARKGYLRFRKLRLISPFA